MSSFIQSSHERIGEILSRQRNYSVPVHQRDFMWTVDHVDQFWADITAAMANADREHFLGAIVFRQIEEDRDYEVIDGQQRLATALILLAAIREAYRDNNDDLWMEIQSTYFGRKDRRTRQTVINFSMNAENDPCFQKHIAQPVARDVTRRAERSRATRLTNKRLLRAFSLFRERIEELTLNAAGFNPAPLADIEDFLLKRLSAILVVVSDEADAFMLFETLNERGLELSILDLVKNFLMGKARDKIEVVKRNWFEMVGELDDRVGVRYLRHFWVSRHGRIQATRLFSDMRSSITSRAAAVRLAKDLRETAALYSALSNSDHSIWDSYAEVSGSIRSSISDLKTLNAVQCYPVLLAALVKFRGKHFDRLLRLMVIMAVRYSLICQYRTGALEIRYADVAHQITKGSISSAMGSYRAIQDLYPSDDTFRNAFAIREIQTAKRSRFLLRRLEGYATSESMEPTNNPQVVNLEHVAPRARPSHWRSIGIKRTDEYEQWAHRLGNHVLLDRKINKEESSREFEEKQPSYQVSPFRLTREAGEVSEWTIKEIQERQRRLAELAVAYWRYET